MFDAFRPFELKTNEVDLRITAFAPRIAKIQVGVRPQGHCTSYLIDVHSVPRAAPSAASSLAGGGNSIIAVDEAGNIVLRNAEGRVLLRFVSSSVATSPDTRLRMEMIGEQHLYGLGEGGQQFDRLGTSRRFWNFQANRGQGADLAVPFLLSQAGYGVFFDNSAVSRIEHGDANEGGTVLDYSGAGGPYDIYVFVGDMRTILGDLAGVLGPATMPPLWSLGYLQSTRFFDTPEDILALGREFRDKNILCDAIIFLSTYGSGLGWNAAVGSLDFEPTLFADPGYVIGGLHELGFRVFSHEYPVVHPGAPLHEEARQRGFLLDHRYPDTRAPDRDGVSFKEGQSFIDFSQPEAREWWWNAHHHLVERGIDGWWLDGGEGPPEHVTLAAGSSKLVHNRFDIW
ncbi:MAG: glycoside hydrolase family 31 protein, partial [Bosea sp. (in: a-proteobacteria)]|nr:glycoside hydrolase family 31 protein [Bosea sp. (in: a-proteobacteria)]